MEQLIKVGCDKEYQYLDRDVASLYSLIPGGGQWYTGEKDKAWLYLLSSPLIVPYIVSFQDAQNSVDYYKIEKEHSPRASFIGFLYSTLNILEPIIPISKNEIEESIISLNHTKKEIDSNNLNERNSSLELASWIKSIPIIYYPWGLQSAAIRFKNSMQENAKKHVLFEDVIEACHNGIVSWEIPSNIQPILLQGKDDHVKTQDRWDIMKEFFQERQIDYKEIFSVDGSILTKLVCLIYSLDMASIYNAVISKIDPSPVNSIDFVKKRL